MNLICMKKYDRRRESLIKIKARSKYVGGRAKSQNASHNPKLQSNQK